MHYCVFCSQRVHQLTGETIDNLRASVKTQYKFFESFTLLHRSEDHWDTINPKSERTLLLKKIGFALFGAPVVTLNAVSTATTDNDVSRMPRSVFSRAGSDGNHEGNGSTGYSTSQLTSMTPIADTITDLSNCSHVQFSCVFVTFKNCSVPLFKIRASNSNTQFVDTNCRVYYDFDDFKINNTLPDVVYCYPENGRYNKAQGFSVNFSMPPASDSTSKVLKKVDTFGQFVSGASGIAAVGALAAPLVGIAVAPIVGIFAIVGGGIAGIYGASRGVARIVNKQKHKEKVSAKDVLNVTTNVFSAMSLGALGAFESVAVLAGRVAQCISSLNGLTVLCSSISDDTPNLFSLLNEIEENALTILFYFNATSILDAFKIIREGLEMEPFARTDKVLDNLVEANRIQSTIGLKGTLRLENYISQGVVDLVITLLKSVNTEIKDLILKVAYIGGVYQNVINEELSEQHFTKELSDIMTFLEQNVQGENEIIRKKAIELVFEITSDSTVAEKDVGNTFISELSSTNEDQIVFVLRHVVLSVTSQIRKANKYFNNIEHKAVTLHSYYDIKAHPQAEITHKIRAMIEQQDSNRDLPFKFSEGSDIILKKVLEFLLECAQPEWKSNQFSEQLLDLNDELTKQFEQELIKCVDLVEKTKNRSCLDVETIFMEFGLNENYGNSLFQKVLEHFQPDPKYKKTKNANSNDVLILPAWNGLIDRLYCYYSRSAVSSKTEMLKLTKENYDLIVLNYDGSFKTNDNNRNICVLKPGDDSLPAHIVFSRVDSGTGKEFGFIWKDK